MEVASNLEPQNSTVEQWGEGLAADPSHSTSEERPEQPRLPQELLLLLRCIARSSQHAVRSKAWLQVINAAIQAWNVLRAVGESAPCAVTMPAGTAPYT